ncbi:MAG: oligopeptide transporter, OPT family [Oscillibacter ruminantium]|uniref:OPT family oligopeptide transporter n=1 Tax=Oscillibacter ruminantium TaxID=1263547 RepID=UPI002B220117|nr:oligopeptide transporter, OPT family [Oscillibacter ruminantium]MEA5041066.1 oligopeptide transporter, OPT family [Oscillibacter ruminantium]
MEEKKFQPYIPADKIMPEFTVVSVILGAILAVVFGGANAYLGLRVGMTVSASIPAAVLSMGIIRFILKRDSILENNMVQTIGSAGESVAAGAIFTLPALFMWANEGLCEVPSLIEIGLIALCGGVLGVLFMVPLRSALIVQEHGTLAYPEGQACAEVLIAGEEGGAKASTVFAGLGIAAAYKFVADGLKVFPSEVAYEIPAYKGSGIGVDVLPALAGVGYICGVKVSSYLFAGGVTAWFVLMPLIALFGGDTVMFPADVTVNELLLQGGPDAMWSKFIRYIGAGAVLAGGIMSLISSLPLIVRTFKDAIGGYGKNGKSTLRTEQDLSMQTLLIGILIMAVALWLIPSIPLNLFSAFIVIIFGFFFATVSSRMVGLIGSSNNPVSGMAIATLLIATLLLKATGQNDINGMIAAITIGGVICVIAAISGDTSQDLKTGFLVGATPKKQQIGEIVGVVVSAIAIGAIMYLLSMAWGYGSNELPAPQAMLMKMVVEGVMGGNLPWTLVFTGVFIAIVVKMLGIPVLPFAIGLYLPIYLSTPIMAGGLLRWFMEKRKYANEKAKNDAVQSGVLYTSGLIAGEGIVGILLAVFAVIGLNVDVSGVFSIGKIGGLVCFAAILFTIYLFANKGAKAATKADK